jgi:hypothetical protein
MKELLIAAKKNEK